MVKVEFYSALQQYLADLRSNPNRIFCVEDVIAYNDEHTDREGGIRGSHPAWPSGQDVLQLAAASKGLKNDTYWKALTFIRSKSREEGLYAALMHEGTMLDGLLVPSYADGGVATSTAAKAGTNDPYDLKQS